MSKHHNSNKYQVRQLEIGDFEKGFLTILEQLTQVGQISYLQFCKRFRNQNSTVFVIEDNNQIIATASIFIEHKFIHHCASVGHIEDVVVSDKHRGLKLGQIIVEHLIDFAKSNDCYKVILNCEEKNIEFYKKCGFEKKETEMAYYFVPKSNL